MLTLLLIAAAVAVAAIGAVAWRRRPHTPSELRGDWWSDFERAFWEYQRQTPPPPRPGPRSAQPSPGRPVEPQGS